MSVVPLTFIHGWVARVGRAATELSTVSGPLPSPTASLPMPSTFATGPAPSVRRVSGTAAAWTDVGSTSATRKAPATSAAVWRTEKVRILQSRQPAVVTPWPGRAMFRA